MFSDIVYLYGDIFSPEVNFLHFREELPSGKKVDQKQLANQVVLAALCSLYAQQYISLYFEEKKIFFIKTKEIKAKRILDKNIFKGLEKDLFNHIASDTLVKDAVSSLLHGYSENPWNEILKITKKHIADEQIIKDDNSKDQESRFNLYSKAKNELASNNDLFAKLRNIVKDAIASHEEKPDAN